MAAVASTGRQRYRWFVLLVAAVALVIWFLTPADRGDPRPSGADTSSGSPSAEPTHRLTETTTAGSDPTTLPSTPPADGRGLPVVRLADLPPQAARTVDLIDAGGPFPEPDHDGGTFHNREDLLPDRPTGYYREYTVPTPGSDDRGARRIVAGEAGELYWTDDHYSSFSRIAR